MTEHHIAGKRGRKNRVVFFWSPATLFVHISSRSEIMIETFLTWLFGMVAPLASFIDQIPA